ncbi:FAD-dependent monooxygenase [Undibacterium sp. Tian12W]|uniref:FAD-dependent monooxygenase n=1 Tax=Undibacterium sp. Tian12W TaxID=3413054 RepID=UPI003BF116AF
MVNNDKEIHILISGASVAGLCSAYWLARYGFKLTVVERAPYLRPGGQALDVRGPALEVADRMGILEALQEHRTRLTGMSSVDAAGQEIYRNTERTLTGGRFDSPDIEILRDDLCKILYEAVDEKVEFLFDDRIISIAQDESGVDVAFANAAPRHFDLLIGADGLHSGVRKLAFGPEEDFIHRLGDWYVATFGMPNFLGLEHWEVFFNDEAAGVGAMLMGLRKDADVRAYVGFSSAEPLDYDYRDIATQKQIVAERVAGAGWVLPQIVDHMMRAEDFHFDSTSQICMDSWSNGRVVLVGDAAYSIALASGQGTTVAMVGAYVLAGELAVHKDALIAGLAAYEQQLRDYVLRNQEVARETNIEMDTISGESVEPGETDEAGISSAPPDFGQLVQPFNLNDYAGFVK